MGNFRKLKPPRKRCDACGGKAIYTDAIEAQFEASYSFQAVVRCQANRNHYHLTSKTPPQEN